MLLAELHCDKQRLDGDSGLPLAQVNGALAEELKDIHALSIKKVWTPAQAQQQQQQQQAAAATAG